MLVRRAAQSPEELALLRGVLADLSDPESLAVYCDWLEDRDDPRGRYLRAFLTAFAEGRPLPPEPKGISPTWADLLALPVRRRLREGYEHGGRDLRRRAKRELPRGFTPLEPHLGIILRAAQPVLRIRIEDPLPLARFRLGTTRAGGLPDLPEGSQWPTGEDHGARWPMQFLLQIDLADLRGTVAEGLLPEAGLLSVFHWPEHHRTPERRLFYAPPGTVLARLPAPRPYHWHPFIRGEEEFPTERAHPLRLADTLRYPRLVPGVPEEYQSWEGLDLCDLLVRNWWEESERDPHWLDRHWLCTPWKPNLCGEWGCYFPFERVPQTYLELLELSGNDALQWGFGDGDELHVFVPADAARQGNFDTVVTDEI